jgi:hypothetical protein
MSDDHETPTRPVSTVTVEMTVEVSTHDRLAKPQQRCCRHHENWTVLRDHLAAEFPMLDKAVVCGEIERARVAVERFGLHVAEGLDTAEAVARNQMMLLTGQRPDNSRLDPESHYRHQPKHR